MYHAWKGEPCMLHAWKEEPCTLHAWKGETHACIMHGTHTSMQVSCAEFPAGKGHDPKFI